MRILIDDEIFFRQRFGGVSRLFANLIAGIPQQSNHHLTFNCGYTENEYLLQLKPNTPSFLKPYHFPLKGKLIRGIYGRISHAKTSHVLSNGAIDVFHPSFYANYYLNILQKSKVPLVFTVHDLIHEQTTGNAHYAQMAAIKAQNIKAAKKIIVVSAHTKKDLLLHYPFVSSSQVQVIPLAQSLPSVGIKPQQLPGNYILHTGERGGYKNFVSLLKAFALISKTNPDLFLFCAGSFPFNQTEKQLAEKLGVANKMVQAKLTDNELRYAYQHAQVFVFPSTYEGFGIPMLEAFDAGVPVIANQATSLPEVGGNAALYVNATNEQQLAEAILHVINNAHIGGELVKKGFERVQQFNWQNHIKQTLQVYNEATS